MKKELEVLNTANEYLYNLGSAIERVVEYIEVENEKKAWELIPDVANGIEWILDVVRLTEKVHKGKINSDNIKNNLEEIVNALESEDYTLVGDLFNYEILPEIEKIHKQIRGLI